MSDNFTLKFCPNCGAKIKMSKAAFCAGCGFSFESFETSENKTKKNVSAKLDVDKIIELAIKYLNGDGVEKNESKAFELLLKAAETGHAAAMNKVGLMYFEGTGVTQSYVKGIEWWSKSADSGFTAAMCNLGYAYSHGQGVIKDIGAAVHWYSKAFDNGDVSGAKNLGDMYGENENYALAKEWYLKAAEKNDAESMCIIGYIYLNGKGVSKNVEVAKQWFKIAAENGNAEAEKELKELESSCFITTAVCGSFGKADDCFELTTFRNFRDNWLALQTDGKSLIEEYYKIAPKIVANIDKLSNSKEIYKNIWTDYLSYCLEFIKSGDNSACKNKYVKMVKTLKKLYFYGS